LLELLKTDFFIVIFIKLRNNFVNHMLILNLFSIKEIFNLIITNKIIFVLFKNTKSKN